jgi:hypothetical protein
MTSPQALTPAQLFQQIKVYEDQIPIPAPFVTVDVGTFDGATGKFAGMTTEVTTSAEPVEHEPGQQPRSPAPRFEGAELVTSVINAQWHETTTREPAPIVSVAPVMLQFNVANYTGPWSVTVNGSTSTAVAGQTSLSVNAWDYVNVQWTLGAGMGSHSDRLLIQRTGSLPAAGAFMIPVVPVAIIYAPPVDSQKKSTATYGQGNTVGTSITYDFNTDSNQTVEDAWTDGSAFRAQLGAVGAALGIAGGDAGAGASKDVSSILALLPSDTQTEEQGITTDSSSTLTVTYTSTSVLGTTALGGGPGVGDTIVFFKDVVVAWGYCGGSMQLCPVAWTEVASTAAQIQSDPAGLGITATDQQLLLSFDPFVAGGVSAALPQDRFVVPPGVQASIEYGGGVTWNQTYTVTRDDKESTSQKTYTSDTDTWSPGEVLQMFGFGSTKSQKTTTVTTATGSDVSQTVTLAANLTSGPTDNFTLAIWYDTLFGTWAFQQLQPAPQPLVSGSGAAPGAIVHLEAGGQVHATVADAQGRYEFRAPNIAPGQAQVVIGNTPAATVTVPGGSSIGPAHPVGPPVPNRATTATTGG